ncbi:MAG: hypothetical protein HGB10_10565 [Coriobacteriia bacterium]|nr:hypothetical protein [Coriobacteriia bacterium]
MEASAEPAVAQIGANERPPATPGLSALALKSIALAFMVVEHFGLYFSPWLPEHTSTVLEYFGRLVAPVFIFVMLESMHHTRSRSRYLTRLWVAAMAMFAGNMAVSAAVRPFSQADPFFPEGHNIFLMLAVAASVVACWDAAKQAVGLRRAGWVLLSLALSAGMIITEGGLQMLPVLCIFYWLHDRQMMMLGVFSAYSVALFAYGWISNPEYFWILENQWAQLTVVPLLALYSGKRGRAGFKWLFYGIYPAHLWLFYVVSNLIPR